MLCDLRNSCNSRLTDHETHGSPSRDLCYVETVQLPVVRSETTPQVTKFVDHQEQAQLKKTKIFTCPFYPLFDPRFANWHLTPYIYFKYVAAYRPVASGIATVSPERYLFSNRSQRRSHMDIASKRFPRQFFLVHQILGIFTSSFT